jgi:outer membrane lipoprotein SlyB
MRSIPLISSTLLIITMCGCAAHPAPIIDIQGVDMARYDDDMADCASYGEQIHIEQGIVKGAAAGAAVGTATGAISGNPGSGAGYGAIFGAAESARFNDREKQRVVKNCMRGRGYRVLN